MRSAGFHRVGGPDQMALSGAKKPSYCPGLPLRLAVLVRPLRPDNSVVNIRGHMPVTRTSLEGRRLPESTRRLRRYRSLAIKKAFDQISNYMPGE
jgi:hypothetical protein